MESIAAGSLAMRVNMPATMSVDDEPTDYDFDFENDQNASLFQIISGTVQLATTGLKSLFATPNSELSPLKEMNREERSNRSNDSSIRYRRRRRRQSPSNSSHSSRSSRQMGEEDNDHKSPENQSSPNLHHPSSSHHHHRHSPSLPASSYLSNRKSNVTSPQFQQKCNHIKLWGPSKMRRHAFKNRVPLQDIPETTETQINPKSNHTLDSNDRKRKSKRKKNKKRRKKRKKTGDHPPNKLTIQRLNALDGRGTNSNEMTGTASLKSFQSSLNTHAGTATIIASMENQIPPPVNPVRFRMASSDCSPSRDFKPSYRARSRSYPLLANDFSHQMEPGSTTMQFPENGPSDEKENETLVIPGDCRPPPLVFVDYPSASGTATGTGSMNGDEYSPISMDLEESESFDESRSSSGEDDDDDEDGGGIRSALNWSLAQGPSASRSSLVDSPIMTGSMSHGKLSHYFASSPDEGAEGDAESESNRRRPRSSGSFLRRGLLLGPLSGVRNASSVESTGSLNSQQTQSSFTRINRGGNSPVGGSTNTGSDMCIVFEHGHGSVSSSVIPVPMINGNESDVSQHTHTSNRSNISWYVVPDE